MVAAKRQFQVGKERQPSTSRFGHGKTAWQGAIVIIGVYLNCKQKDMVVGCL
jgi:hypothetical protein